jgi:hypothetical protein
MNARGRMVGTPIVYLATAIMAEAIAEVALIVSNKGHFPVDYWSILIMLLSPLVGFLVAGRYWTESEFAPSRVVLTPVLLLGLMVLVLALSSYVIERPGLASGQLPQVVVPQVSPSALPALPPPPTRSIRTYSAHEPAVLGGRAPAVAQGRPQRGEAV